MAGIFRDTPFQGDVSMWDVSNVWKMLEAFMDTPYFNGDLSSWKVQRVTTMRLMFAGASAFDGDLPWDVSGVFDTYGMFRGAKSFTGKGLNLWNPYQANSMAFMFHNASSFRQDLCAWQLSASPNVTQMFQGTACPHQTDPVETYSICVSCSN